MTEFKTGDSVRIKKESKSSQSGKEATILVSEGALHYRLMFTGENHAWLFRWDEIEHYRDPRDVALDAIKQAFDSETDDILLADKIDRALRSVGR
jgi:N-glycosylase/DNA lyase